MKKVVLITAISFISLSTFAQDNNATATVMSSMTETQKSSPEPLLIQEEIYDFGKIPQGKPVHHIFTVTNIGQLPLKISNVQASCGCTTPEWDKENAIAPGQTSKITVGYNAAAEGAFNKTITVSYNETGSKIITIKGEVWKTPAASAPENNGINDLNN